MTIASASTSAPAASAPAPASGSAVPRAVTACPWCGAGTQLDLCGDGMGAVAMSCTQCGAKGPSVPMNADFAEVDQRAIALWSGRRQGKPVARETLNRVGMAVRLHCLTGRLTPDATIGVAWSDLDLLLRSATPADTPPPA